MNRNLRVYPVYQALLHSMCWMPVFTLYFLSIVTPAQFLLLEAVYYAGMVLLEVPSGYVSDRFGRRATLLISATLGVAAYAVFSFLPSFEWFVAAQALLAGCLAFNSGTDTSLLYDTLLALERENEFARREARAHSLAFMSAGIAGLVGGVAAGMNLALGYILSLAAQAGVLVSAVFLAEPPAARTTASFPRQVLRCAGGFRDRTLFWALALMVTATVLNHVPYEFAQRYLDLLIPARAEGGYRAAAPLSGAVSLGAMLLASVASRLAPEAGRRLGVRGVLLFSVLLQVGVIAAMAIVLHPAVVGALLLRTCPRGLQTPLVRRMVHARIGSDVRATFFSLISLAGRLAFSACLALSANLMGAAETLEFQVMARTLGWFAAGGLAAFALLMLLLPRITQNSVAPEEP